MLKRIMLYFYRAVTKQDVKPTRRFVAVSHRPAYQSKTVEQHPRLFTDYSDFNEDQLLRNRSENYWGRQ